MGQKGFLNVLIGLIVAIIFIGGGGVFWWQHIQILQLEEFSLDTNVYSVCESGKDKIIRYSCYKDAALYALENGTSIDTVFQFISDSPRERHLKEHSIGRAALLVSDYNLYEVKILCGTNCTAAYYHGISEEWAEYAPSRIDEYMDFINSVCSLMGHGKSVSCTHHVGHFNMSVSKNFAESMTLCNTFENYDRFSYCAYGVIHERLIQSGTENLFEICSGLRDRSKTVCYVRGSHLYPKWLADDPKVYKNPLEVCSEINGKIPLDLNYCYATAAWMLKKSGELLDTQWCQKLDKKFEKLCVKGLKFPESYREDPSMDSPAESNCAIEEIGENECGFEIL